MCIVQNIQIVCACNTPITNEPEVCFF